jgi:predicted transcriptional regulator
MIEAAILAEAKRLKTGGRGYRSIAAELGATRHQVRHWLNQRNPKDIPTATRRPDGDSARRSGPTPRA